MAGLVDLDREALLARAAWPKTCFLEPRFTGRYAVRSMSGARRVSVAAERDA